MCGILGVIKKQGLVNVDSFKKLNNLQGHRGPDGGNIWIYSDKKIALGHTRLSVIDLKGGSQPMMSSDKNFVITFNGEIYNYNDLKKKLIKKGYVFKTTSDTEVVLYSFMEWGEECVIQFRGMFAFAVMDLKKEEVFLARDIFGIKPLIYYSDKNIFCFASEIKTLSQIKNLDLSIDFKSIDYYLWLQYIPAPLTIFKKIKKIEPACFMKVNFKGEIMSRKRYWKPVFKTEKNKNFEDWAEEFESLISDSIKMHTISDVPYGAFLSGGIDSTLIVKYLSEFKKEKLKTFSIGFNETEYNELEYSNQVAKKFGTDHYTKTVKPDFFSVFKDLVLHYGEPFGDSSAIPVYYVSKLASQHVKVVLSGDGGDELFGGYNSYQVWQSLINKKKDRKFYLNFVRFWLSMLRPKRFIPEKPNLDAWIGVVSYFDYYKRKFIWKNDYQKYINREYEVFDDFKNVFYHSSIVNKAQLFDMVNYLPFDILTKVDIASMMNGLEVRVPFLDKKVIEFALSVPEEINFNENGIWEGKRILKKNLSSDFNSEFVHRAKKGFAVPLDKWFSQGGELYSVPYLKLINSESKIFNDIFNKDAVYNFISSGDYSKTYFLLFLEEWLRQYENNNNKITI